MQHDEKIDIFFDARHATWKPLQCRCAITHCFSIIWRMLHAHYASSHLMRYAAGDGAGSSTRHAADVVYYRPCFFAAYGFRHICHII